METPILPRTHYKNHMQGLNATAVQGGAQQDSGSQESGSKDTYTFSKKSVMIYFIVLFLLLVMAGIGVVRHVKYMKKNCAMGVTGGSVASYFTTLEY